MIQKKMSMKHQMSIEGSRDLHSDNTTELAFYSYITMYAVLQGCDASKLRDKKLITATLLSSLLEGEMKLYKFFAHQFKDGGGGITAGAIIGSSHVVVSTYPELNCLSIDISSCSGYPLNTLNVFIRSFKPKSYELTVLPPFLAIAKTTPRIILDKTDISDQDLVKWCENRGLLPLFNTSENFLTLVNTLGFIFGDGIIYENLSRACIYHKDKNILDVLGKRLDGLKVNWDVRSRYDEISTHESFELFIDDNNFCKLLHLLGAPKGSKRNFKIPDWLERESEPIKALFLSPLFLSRSVRYENTNGVTYEFVLKINDNEKNKRDLKLNSLLRIIKQLHLEVESVKESVNKSECKCKTEEGAKYEIKFFPTSDNFLRIQSLISLSKIYPLGLFDFNFHINGLKKNNNINIIPKQYNSYQRIIEYLLTYKKASVVEIARNFNISEKNICKWLKKLNELGIILNNNKGEKTNEWVLNI